MSLFFYIAAYIVSSIFIAFYLKSRKVAKAKKEIKVFDREKENDYLNDPKFSYMSCNKYNPESSFYDNPVKVYITRIGSKPSSFDAYSIETCTTSINSEFSLFKNDFLDGYNGMINNQYTCMNPSNIHSCCD